MPAENVAEFRERNQRQSANFSEDNQRENEKEKNHESLRGSQISNFKSLSQFQNVPNLIDFCHFFE